MIALDTAVIVIYAYRRALVRIRHQQPVIGICWYNLVLVVRLARLALAVQVVYLDPVALAGRTVLILERQALVVHPALQAPMEQMDRRGPVELRELVAHPARVGTAVHQVVLVQVLQVSRVVHRVLVVQMVRQALVVRQVLVVRQALVVQTGQVELVEQTAPTGLVVLAVQVVQAVQVEHLVQMGRLVHLVHLELAELPAPVVPAVQAVQLP
jgi:hypothetical protein